MTVSRPVPANSSPAPEPTTASRIPVDDVWRATEELLRRSDSAAVVAIGAHGQFLPMPPEIPRFGHPVIEGHTSALELVAPAEMPAVIEAWKRSLIDGAGRIEVQSSNPSVGRITLHFLDVRDRYQVLLGVVVHHERPVAQRDPVDGLRPRHSSVRKNELSEFVAVDESFELVLGYARSELLGRRNLELIHPDDHPVAIANWVDLLAAPGRSRRVRLRQRHRDGRWIWFEVTNHNRLGEAESAIVAEMIDISEEMAARDAAATLTSLIEGLPIGVLHVGPDGVVRHRNRRASELLGPISGSTPAADVDPAVIAGLIADALNLGAAAELELPIQRGDGAVGHCRVTVRALTDEDGGSSGALVCLDDVTELMRCRDERQRLTTLPTAS